MAVQAQYPSNVLFLNRNGQDHQGHDYSLLQQQPGGLTLLDQSHMLFNTNNNNNNNNNNNGGGINPRKRGREISASTAINLPLNHHQPQLIDLSQLNTHHHHHPNAVSTGLRLSFSDHHHHQIQQQQNQQNIARRSSVFSSLLTEDLTSQIKQQRDELNQFLQTQGEALRRTLAEKMQVHYRALIGAAEEPVARRLREKEAEVEKAARRNAELEARAAQLNVEAQVWQARARAQEATAASLQAQLHHAVMIVGSAQDKSEGIECAGGVEGQAEDAESGYVDPDRATTSGPSCKACRKRVAAVVLLPCRHLCLCTDCDQVVQACPLCFCLRNSSVEVYLS